MPNTDWKILNPLQLGRYAEYYAKMEFASYGLEVYTSEVDDHGIDFVVKDKRGNFYEIQVKSIRGNTGYVFMQKSKFDIDNNRIWLVLLVFLEGKTPDIFLVPTEAWRKENPVFVDRKYDKDGQKSHPEWGVNISRKHYSVLEEYGFENIVKGMI